MSATVKRISTSKLTEDLYELLVNRPPGHEHVPGQFVTLSQPGSDKKNYYAIASHNEEGDLLFIIKQPPGEKNGILEADEIEISEAMGNGFNLDDIENKDILIITHGSGFSAMRPLAIELQKNRQNFKAISFVYGVRNLENLPYLKWFESLVSDIDFVLAFSRPGHSSTSALKSVTGRVQAILEKADFKPDDTVVFLVGSKEMSENVKELLIKKGFSVEKILSNY